MREMTNEELEIYNNMLKQDSRKTGERIDFMNNNDFTAMLACLGLISLAFIGCSAEQEQNDSSETWKDRLLDEHNDLLDKYRKLCKFFEDDDIREKVTVAEFERLAAQKNAMFDYLSVLTARMKAAGIEIPKD